MTVLIVSTVGARNKYSNAEMFKKSFRGFLNSLERQTDKDFKLFLTGHDKLEEVEKDWIYWSSLKCDEECSYSAIPISYPENPGEGHTCKYKIVKYGDKITDMSRKTQYSIMIAGLWAWRNDICNFWMLRMDSDDFLDKDHISFLNNLDPKRIRAVYNKNCHMFDAQTGEVAEHYYPYSTTCNATFMSIDREGCIFPNWYFHFDDHTKFVNRIREAGIPSVERDWSLCILTNSTNHLSGRPAVRNEKHIRIIKYTKEIKDKYGLSNF